MLKRLAAQRPLRVGDRFRIREDGPAYTVVRVNERMALAYVRSDGPASIAKVPAKVDGWGKAIVPARAYPMLVISVRSVVYPIR